MSALAVLVGLSSCGLEEPYGTSQNESSVIEFVARPVGFNNQTIDTKSTATGDIETKIYSCYLLVFDRTTKSLIYSSSNLIPTNQAATSISPQRLDINKKIHTSLKACFIANVPENFIYSTNNEPIINTIDALNAAVLGPDHFIYATNSSTVPIGTPSISINGTSYNCIPAYGEADIDIANGAVGPVQISLKRLFAKVTVNLNMQRTDVGNMINTYFAFKSYSLTNIPKKVKLLEGTSESGWATDISDEAHKVSFTNITQSLMDQNINIYNTGSSLSDFQEYSFDFYLPEYYVAPKKSLSDNEQDKPINVDTEKKCPVYISLMGIYTPLRGNDINLVYDIYLGENNTNNFNLQRNKHYVNTLTIKGTQSHAEQTDDMYLDHRVHADTDFDMVKLFGETANCYLVRNVGRYIIPAIRGVYKGDMNAPDVPWCTGKKVELLAYDNNNLRTILPEYDPTNHEISFDVETVENGNIIIAMYYEDDPTTTEVREDQNIEWSWHFWFNSGFEILNYETIGVTNQTYPNTAIVMDRNLGASYTSSLADEGIGLYYQYGNKNPYINNDYKGGGSRGNSTWVPESGTKAINDPCPPGYVVPTTAIWPDANPQNATLDVLGIYDGTETMLLYDQDNLDNDVYYPYSGYIAASGSAPISNLTNVPKTFSADNFTHSAIESTNTEYIGGWSQVTRETRVTAYCSNVDYTIISNATIGATLHKNGILPYVSYVLPWENIQDFRISAFDKYTVTVVIERNILDWAGKEISKTTSEQTRITNPDPSSNFITGMASLLFLQLGFTGKMNVVEYGNQCNPSHITYNSIYGYQLRCVSESSPIK